MRALVPDATAVDYDDREDTAAAGVTHARAATPLTARRGGGAAPGAEEAPSSGAGGGGGHPGVPQLGRLASAGSLFNVANGGSVPAEEAMRADELLLLVLEPGSFFGEQVCVCVCGCGNARAWAGWILQACVCVH